MYRQGVKQGHEVLAPEEAIRDFLTSLTATLEKARAVERFAVVQRYRAALKTFIDYGELAELAFSNEKITIQDMLYFGPKGGHIGVPVIDEYQGEDDDDDEV